jgi:hypothetical protein
MHMKKLLFFAVSMFAAVASFAQDKGDLYVSGSIALDLGTQTTTLSSGGSSISASQPLSTELDFAVECGYFVADNLKVGLACCVPFLSSPTSQLDGTWLSQDTAAFTLNPNVAYYLRLADNLYYTPEVGFAFNFGSVKDHLPKTDTSSTPFWGWDVYANLLALELRVTDKIAIGAVVGSLLYGSAITSSDDLKVQTSVNQFKFNLNKTSLHFRYYF